MCIPKILTFHLNWFISSSKSTLVIIGLAKLKVAYDDAFGVWITPPNIVTEHVYQEVVNGHDKCLSLQP